MKIAPDFCSNAAARKKALFLFSIHNAALLPYSYEIRHLCWKQENNDFVSILIWMESKLSYYEINDIMRAAQNLQ